MHFNDDDGDDGGKPIGLGYFSCLSNNWYKHVTFFFELQQFCRAENIERGKLIDAARRKARMR